MAKFLKRAVLPMLAFILLAPFGVFFPALGAFNPATLVGIATVATLTSGNYLPYPYIYLVGYNSFGDGGSGVLAYKAGVVANDHCTIFNDASSHVFQRLDTTTALNVNQCGAYGDNNTHDDSAAFSYAFAASTHVVCTAGDIYGLRAQVTGVQVNTTFDCSGAKILLAESPSSTQFLDIEVKGFTAQNVVLTGVGNGFQLGNTADASNAKFLNVTVDSVSSGIDHVFYLGTATGVWIDKCKLTATGYGVLQISNKATNDVLITNCQASDMYADAIEQNGGGVGSKNWTISNFIFDGSHSFPSAQLEERFAGFTSVDGLVISNSQVKNANGDSCVHLEGTVTRITLTGNIFHDCLTAGGNDGYIYILTSTANITASGNTFYQTSATTAAQFAYSTASGNYGGDMTVTGDRFFDTSGGHHFGAFNLTFHTGITKITGGSGDGLAYYVQAFSTNNLTVSGVQTLDTTQDIYYTTGSQASGSGGTDVQISGNSFYCIHYCILSQKNSNGTGPPTNWKVTNNSFDGTAAAEGVNLQDAVNSWGSGNWYGSNLTNTTVATTAGANTVNYKDFLQGSGVIH